MLYPELVRVGNAIHDHKMGERDSSTFFENSVPLIMCATGGEERESSIRKEYCPNSEHPCPCMEGGGDKKQDNSYLGHLKLQALKVRNRVLQWEAQPKIIILTFVMKSRNLFYFNFLFPKFWHVFKFLQKLSLKTRSAEVVFDGLK